MVDQRSLQCLQKGIPSTISVSQQGIVIVLLSWRANLAPVHRSHFAPMSMNGTDALWTRNDTADAILTIGSDEMSPTKGKSCGKLSERSKNGRLMPAVPSLIFASAIEVAITICIQQKSETMNKNCGQLLEVEWKTVHRREKIKRKCL